ncbi:MAG: dephospho-CoA kinase [Deltaproteobacteria bacterium]|nr:dephospho-CoA kinase [Deltaproteobacteria bacterium]
MIVAGLTGGIGTGKSTVGAIFAEAGAAVIDADEIARNMVAKERPAWRRIVAHFGRDILLPNGDIDRKKLGTIIFNDARQRAHLDRIVHPCVMAEIKRRREEIEKTRPRAVVILDVPLLIEAGMDRGLDEVMVVYVPEAVQLERLMRRDGLSAAEGLSRIRSQMPIEEKKRRATVVIDNSAAPSVTRKRVLEVFADLRRRSYRS